MLRPRRLLMPTLAKTLTAIVDTFKLPDSESEFQSQAWKEACEAVRRGRHALNCLLRYRDAGTWDSAALVDSHCRALYKALQSTPFGQAFDSEVAEKLLSVAEHVELAHGSFIREEEGKKASLYIVLGGIVEVVRTEQKAAGGSRLRVSIQSATLQAAGIDPDLKLSCALSYGMTRIQTLWMPRGDDPANIEWHFVGSFPHEGDQQLIVTLMGCKESDDAEGLALGFGVLEAQKIKGGFEGSLNLTTSPPVFATQQESGDSGEAHECIGSVRISVSLAVERRKMSKSTSDKIRSTSIESNDVPMQPLKQHEAAKSISPIAAKRKTNSLNAKAQPRIANGQKFGTGDYFSSEGIAVVCSGPCEFLKVDQGYLTELLRGIENERSQHRDAFLRKWLPGLEHIDNKAWENFSGAFHLASFPKNHVFCNAGRRGDQPQVFLVVEGECRMHAAQQSPVDAATCGIDAVKVVVPRREQVGLVGEGQLLGFASALFGGPEPFTAVASTGVKAYVWQGHAEKAAAGWPKDALKPLAADLRMRVVHQRRRDDDLIAAGQSMVWEPSADLIKASTMTSLRDSPFLRNKDTSKSWKVKSLHDHCAGWSPADAKRHPPQSTSTPQLPQASMKPPEGRNPYVRPTVTNRGSLPQLQTRTNRLPNLKNPTDWDHMTSCASRNAMMKMYRQRVRLGPTGGRSEILAGRSVVDLARTAVGKIEGYR